MNLNLEKRLTALLEHSNNLLNRKQTEEYKVGFVDDASWQCMSTLVTLQGNYSPLCLYPSQRTTFGYNRTIYSRWVFRYRSFVGRHILDIICVQPLDLEMKVHVGRGFAKTVLLMLLKCILHIHCKQTPHSGCR